MKTLFKLISVVAILVGIAKLIEIAIDVLYKNCGRHYITAQTEE